jgi:hypothetical protein
MEAGKQFVLREQRLSGLVLSFVDVDVIVIFIDHDLDDGFDLQLAADAAGHPTKFRPRMVAS